VVSDLLGASGLRILHALAEGETDPKQLALLGDDRLKCSEEQLVDALTGRAQPMHRQMLALQLERPHQEAVVRLAPTDATGICSITEQRSLSP
jgi:hypothetical protein